MAQTTLDQYPALGGYWKCEGCGLIIEDELFVCPECTAKKVDDLAKYIGVNGSTLDQQDEMIADNGFKDNG